MDAWYRLESTEHYAMVIMYTSNIIGKANVLSCEQVNELIEIRGKLGITSGGIPPCSARPTNLQDVIAGNSPVGTAPMLNSNNSSCGCAGGQTQSELDVQAITQAVLARLQNLNK